MPPPPKVQGVRGAGGKLVGLGAVVVCLVVATPANSIPDKPPKCTATDGVMTLENGYWRTEVVREGDRIVPSYAKGEISCGPVDPTVNNIDSMAIDADGTTLDFRGGPFAPGLTPEADGESEIEITMPIGLLGGLIDFRFGSTDDHMAIGALSAKAEGINLNAGSGDTDVDLVLNAEEPKYLKYSSIDLFAGRGDDTIEAGGPGFDGPDRYGTIGIQAEEGDDTISGGNGIDFIKAGPGRDTISGGRGNDYLFTREDEPDQINCGPDEDALFRDRKDKGKSCEHSYLNRKQVKNDPPPLPFRGP